MPLTPSLAPSSSHGVCWDAIDDHKSILDKLGFTERLTAFVPLHISPTEYFWQDDQAFGTNGPCPMEILLDIRERTGGAFHSLPLEGQCSALQIPYERITFLELGDQSLMGKRNGMSIEDAVLKRYCANGWRGERFEGATIFLALEALRLVIAKKRGVSMFPPKRSNGYATVRELGEKEVTALDSALDLGLPASMSKLLRDVKRGKPTPVPKGTSKLEEKVMHECFLALFTTGVLRQIAQQWMCGFGGFGWPDLTLFKDDHVSFVEVKQTKDKLNLRQAYWARNFALPLGLDFRCKHVTIT